MYRSTFAHLLSDAFDKFQGYQTRDTNIYFTMYTKGSTLETTTTMQQRKIDHFRFFTAVICT